ncbi:MAG: MoaD/ThiS family protein [Pseudomonadota bacterium]
MSIKINIPPHSQHLIDNVGVVEVNGNTVGECLKHLVQKFPGIKTGLFNKDGKLFDYVDLYVNEESAFPEELAKPVKDGDELHIVMMIAGG